MNNEQYVCKNGSAICWQQMETCDACIKDVNNKLTQKELEYDQFMMGSGRCDDDEY